MSKLWALAATIEFEGPGLDGISLGFRIFGGKATDVITGEAEKKGADAVQGKVKLTLLDQFTGQNFKSQITAVGGADILDYNRNTGKYSLTKDGLKKYKKVKFRLPTQEEFQQAAFGIYGRITSGSRGAIVKKGKDKKQI